MSAFGAPFSPGEPIEREAQKVAAGVGLGGNDKDDNPENALKHCYWSCRLAEVLGQYEAKCITDIHEECGVDFGSPSSNMDLNNNLKGRSLGKQPRANCRSACMQELCGGGLTCLKGDDLHRLPAVCTRNGMAIGGGACFK